MKSSFDWPSWMVFEFAFRFFRFRVSGEEDMEQEDGEVIDDDEDIDEMKLNSSLYK